LGWGTTTTPFDMVMLNDLERCHLVMDVIERAPFLGSHAAPSRQLLELALLSTGSFEPSGSLAS